MLFDEIFTRTSINADALVETFRLEFDSTISGVSIDHGGEQNTVTVHFIQPPSEDEIQRAWELIEAHDPSIKSADQRAQEALEQIRRHFIAQPLDVEEFGNDDQLLRHIAERVAWLEHEIARLVR